MLLYLLFYVICCQVDVYQIFPKKNVSLNNSDKNKDIIQFILVVCVFLFYKLKWARSTVELMIIIEFHMFEIEMKLEIISNKSKKK